MLYSLGAAGSTVNLQVFDVTNPVKPALKGTLRLTGEYGQPQLAASGGKVVVSSTQTIIELMEPKSKIHFIDARTPTRVVETVAYQLDHRIAGLGTDGNVACAIADQMGNMELVTYDITNIAEAREVGTLSFSGVTFFESPGNVALPEAMPGSPATSGTCSAPTFTTPRRPGWRDQTTSPDSPRIWRWWGTWPTWPTPFPRG
jgi:hypothetical protein